jgi:hypothetical protein
MAPQLLASAAEAKQKPLKDQWLQNYYNAEYGRQTFGENSRSLVHTQDTGVIKRHGSMLQSLPTMSMKDFRPKPRRAAAIDLEDAYNRVPFKYLMRMLLGLDVRPIIIRWIAS